jgi:hyperosmotically inducible periplasmic protein
MRKSLLAASFYASLGVASACCFAVDADAPQNAGQSAGAAAADSVITAKVKAKFLDDSRFQNSKISVTTTNGTVKLTGTAPSASLAAAARQLAASVDGVTSVDNQISSPSGGAGG